MHNSANTGHWGLEIGKGDDGDRRSKGEGEKKGREWKGVKEGEEESMGEGGGEEVEEEERERRRRKETEEDRGCRPTKVGLA